MVSKKNKPTTKIEKLSPFQHQYQCVNFDYCSESLSFFILLPHPNRDRKLNPFKIKLGQH